MRDWCLLLTSFGSCAIWRKSKLQATQDPCSRKEDLWGRGKGNCCCLCLGFTQRDFLLPVSVGVISRVMVCFTSLPPCFKSIYTICDFGNMLVAWFTFTALVLDAAQTEELRWTLMFVHVPVKALCAVYYGTQIESDSRTSCLKDKMVSTPSVNNLKQAGQTTGTRIIWGKPLNKKKKQLLDQHTILKKGHIN